jgi:hypothetical protein
MWFAAFQSYQDSPWIIHIAYKLLSGDAKSVNALFSSNQYDSPFFTTTNATCSGFWPQLFHPSEELTFIAPIHVRAELYEV